MASASDKLHGNIAGKSLYGLIHGSISVDQLTEKLFKLLNKEIKTNQGLLTRSALSKADKKAFDDYLEILLEFNLIFKKAGTIDIYVVPQYLPDNPYTIHFQQLIPIAYVIKSPYLPRALVTRFLVAYANAEGNYYWRNGAFFKRGNFHLFVQMDAYQQTVTIHIGDGPTQERYTILNEIFQFFTLPERKEANRLDSISPNKDELRQPEQAPLSENDTKTIELSSDGVEFATVTDLKQAIDKQITKVKSTAGNYINISPIMHKLLNAGAPTPKKIFLSYAHKDEQYKKELRP